MQFNGSLPAIDVDAKTARWTVCRQGGKQHIAVGKANDGRTREYWQSYDDDGRWGKLAELTSEGARFADSVGSTLAERSLADSRRRIEWNPIVVDIDCRLIEPTRGCSPEWLRLRCCTR